MVVAIYLKKKEDRRAFCEKFANIYIGIARGE
jgi:hypothetical protein